MPPKTATSELPIEPSLAARVRWSLALVREIGAMPGDGRRRLGRLLAEVQLRFDATASCATTLRPTAAGSEVVDRVERNWSEAAELCRARADLNRFRALETSDALTSDGGGGVVLSAVVEHDALASTRVDLYRPAGRLAFARSDAAWLTLIAEGALGRNLRPRSAVAGRLAHLSPRERETLDHLLAGASEKEVASRIGRSQHTVHAYVKKIYRQMHVSSRAELLAIFVGDREQAAPNSPGAGAVQRAAGAGREM